MASEEATRQTNDLRTPDGLLKISDGSHQDPNAVWIPRSANAQHPHGYATLATLVEGRCSIYRSVVSWKDQNGVHREKDMELSILRAYNSGHPIVEQWWGQYLEALKALEEPSSRKTPCEFSLQHAFTGSRSSDDSDDEISQDQPFVPCTYPSIYEGCLGTMYGAMMGFSVLSQGRVRTLSIKTMIGFCRAGKISKDFLKSVVSTRDHLQHKFLEDEDETLWNSFLSEE